VFSIAYVILPFSEPPPADAIRVSLARFQRGRRGDLPEGWLIFRDEPRNSAKSTKRTTTLRSRTPGAPNRGGHRLILVDGYHECAR
jgi:hypothetical protein